MPDSVPAWTVVCQAPLSMGILQARILPCPSLWDLPNLEMEPTSPTSQVDSLPSEPPGKPNNPGVGTVSLLQGKFPTRESNRDLMHYRWILYQLNYLGSPLIILPYILPYDLFWVNFHIWHEEEIQLHPLACGCPVVTVTFVEKIIISFFNYIGSPIKKINWLQMWRFIYEL